MTNELNMYKGMIGALKKKPKGKINLGSIYGKRVLGAQESCSSVFC